MFLRQILLSGIACVALCGGAMAATAQATPNAPSSAPPASSSTGAAGTTAATVPAASASAAGTAITDVKNPRTALKSASVEASDGTKVGKVSKVHVDSTGQAQSIDVKVGAKTVSLPAAQATFDESNKIVVAQLTADDIKALPKPGKSSSGMMSSPSTGGSDSFTPAPATGGTSAPTTPANK
ncbi:MAG: hypothetical protein WAW96_17355 [Alphaproteobacteria bacterium]